MIFAITAATKNINPYVTINRKNTPALLPHAFLGLITAKIIGVTIHMVTATMRQDAYVSNIYSASKSSTNSAWNTITSIVHF